VSHGESQYYEPIKNALWDAFSHMPATCYLEITNKGLSDKLERSLDDFALFYIKIDRQYPDITGFIETSYGKERITVEVKERIRKIESFFQAKRYGEVFDARYAFLISLEPFPEQVRRFIQKRPAIYNYSYGKQLIIARFDASSEQFKIDKALYYGSMPEPFKTAYRPHVYFFDPKANKENIVGERTIVIGRTAYNMTNMIDALVRKGEVTYTNVNLSGLTYKDWLAKNRLQELARPPTKEELDP
jgi:hypothetical protein